MVSIKLYGQPAWEIGTMHDLTPERLRALAVTLQARLENAASALDLLTQHGWQIDPDAVYQIHLRKALEPSDAAQELETIGLSYLIPTITELWVSREA